MRRGPIIVLIFILVVAAVIGASQFMRAQPPLEITVAVSPLAGTWVSSAANNFNASNTLVNGTRRVQVKVTTIDDLAVWSDAGQSQWLTDHPTAWIPAASASVGYANRLSFENVQPSVAQTVLMWGGFGDRVDALTDKGAHALDWDDVERAAVAGTWANIPGANASWGNINLAFSRPSGSVSGLAVLFSGAAAFSKQAALSGSTVVASDYQNWMEPILQSVPSYNTLGTSVAQTLAARGSSVGDIALLPESEWLNNLSGQLVSGGSPIRLSYPTYPFVFDFPLVRWQGLSDDENAAVAAFGAYLLTQHPESAGLRPANGSVPQTAKLFADGESYGVLLAPDLSLALQAPPRAETQRLLVWAAAVR
ncbi:MAG: hypothetical protein GC204_06615 [Chloroflexi bacterium]|nr:hypothetical protein [Chloroflexota bacterium]